MGTDIHGVFQRRTDKGWEDIPSNYTQDRHYQLFAVLAGVRNGAGFAGIKTGQPVRPIAPDRGLPDDFLINGDAHPLASLDLMDPRRREWHEDGEPLEVWMGDHSHSWVSGEECALWFQNAPIVEKCGVLDRATYEAWDGKSAPKSWSGGVLGRGVITVDQRDLPSDTTQVATAVAPWTHIRVYWQQSLQDELKYFFDEVKRLEHEFGEVRFVFGFDS